VHTLVNSSTRSASSSRSKPVQRSKPQKMQQPNQGPGERRKFTVR
jgi:hypothetical protein